MRPSLPAPCNNAQHVGQRRANPLAPISPDLVRVGSRRWFLQTGMGAVGGLSLAQLVAQQAQANPSSARRDRKSVILFWLSGGPSHIDMWDPKPDAPLEIRGPYNTIPTSVPGIQLSEHLPLQAQLMHKLNLIRAVDCSASNHTPITMQAGNALARRTDGDKDGGGYPSMGSVVAKFRGPNEPTLPAFVGLADSWKADVWGAGHMGHEHEPIQGRELPGRLSMPEGVKVDRLQDRDDLRRQFDRLRHELDRGKIMAGTEQYQSQAYEMVLAGKVQKAFDIGQETDATRDAYGRISVGEKALLARRLVEAGVSFVLVSGAWGYFDNHGDTVPPWGGILKGLTPILPTVDRVIYTLVKDLDDRGLLDSTLVLMMGEFGRTPVMSADAGRGHWTNVMSMLVAGGGTRGGQVIGSTDERGYGPKDGRVTPSDLAATVFRHMGIDLDAHWISPQGRPTPIVTEGGRPIPL